MSCLLLCIGVLGAAHCISAQPSLPALATAQGHNSAVTPTGDSITIDFQPTEWPNALWSAEPGQSWNWQDHAILAFDVVNPGGKSVDFFVRVDDDPAADGVTHCRTAEASIAPRKSEAFCVDLTADDPMQAEGMRGGPPSLGCDGLRAMTGTGKIDPSHIVAFQLFLHNPAAPCSLSISHLRLLPSQTTDKRYAGITDAYGQFTRADWPGKVHSATDFHVRRSAEDKEIALVPALPDRDTYGGWLSGPQLAKTGFFSTVQRNGRWWLVTPNGHLFLSLGINAVSSEEYTIVHSREAMFTELPGPTDPLARHYGEGTKTFDFYSTNLERKYGPTYSRDWLRTASARLKSWGFNTIGNWSNEELEALHQVPYTATLSVNTSHGHLLTGSKDKGGMEDPFDPQFAADCDASFRARASRLRNDTWCLGYFVDNELPWNGLAFDALAAPADQPAKQAFLSQLQTKYHTVQQLNTAWGVSVKNWADLTAPFQASRTPSTAQKQDMSEFAYRLALQYFTVVRSTLRKYDPHHLYLGCRFAEHNPDAERAAAELCDVVSFNVYQPSLSAADWDFADHLNKPCLISEFHFGALDRGMFSPGLVSAPTQATRAAMFRDYVNSVLDHPAFVGAHWFQYSDEPLTGRSLDGENYNIGFVSIADRALPGDGSRISPDPGRGLFKARAQDGPSLSANPLLFDNKFGLFGKLLPARRPANTLDGAGDRGSDLPFLRARQTPQWPDDFDQEMSWKQYPPMADALFKTKKLPCHRTRERKYSCCWPHVEDDSLRG